MAVPSPSPQEFVARVDRDQVPKDVDRRVSSVVTGVATLGFGGLTALLAALLLQNPASKSGPMLILVWLFVVLLGGATTGFGFLTWRWARSLPPSQRLATTRERDELAG
jgi:hypothetical protein